jgi:hypothetical protein
MPPTLGWDSSAFAGWTGEGARLSPVTLLICAAQARGSFHLEQARK